MIEIGVNGGKQGLKKIGTSVYVTNGVDAVTIGKSRAISLSEPPGQARSQSICFEDDRNLRFLPLRIAERPRRRYCEKFWSLSSASSVATLSRISSGPADPARAEESLPIEWSVTAL
jgi:hypothetical protein